MKNVIESLGEVLPEYIGLAAVILGLSAVIAVFQTFGDAFISLFL